ncbi:hypothetical protein NCU02324 [Neurospora crassa OR74A]|uniref:OTU domain-containing protein n=1 Tax=Neurospora crassa (strain ATCC 24698 / 74-OR23-1A / CBS 708.71 / DSM 1257 / FGSC 987) TaxID=367110 RepID=Q7S4U0_NEUCR|nr:hypothetical protein NCU02324 [Neurospora crassa OR74A]EAA30514.1 hypothetical protein NCU02324 [Neurospora crassa OR74A]|eukprot:XP_959750.1 hypothetical protein NCU02324 [Neurospora crassa OR74A]
MVEKVVFVMHPNRWHSEDRDGKHLEDGHCYWTSVALLIYGSASFWLLVKAEHLWYLESILNNPHHPRHDFYKSMMETKFNTKADGIRGQYTEIQGDFNLWEALHIPGLWVNHDPCYLTADLYKVFLVLYKYDSNVDVQFINKVYDMKTFGAYNSRHVFLCYAHGNHYRPMLPNDYLPYEFRLPRPTLAATKMYKLQTAEHNRPVDGLSHHWRAPLNSIPSSLLLPRGPHQDSVTESHIYRVVGYDPPDLPPARPKRKFIVIDDDDDDPKLPSPKNAKVEKTATQTQSAEAMKPRSPTPTPTPAPKATTPVKYTPRNHRLPSPRVLRPPRPLPIPNCPVVIPPVGKAFEALCGELDEAEMTQGQTTSTALISRGPFGLTALSSRPPPDLTKLYTYFPHHDRQLLDSFYAWLIQPENIVKPVYQVLDALELGNQRFEQAKNPALAIRSLLGPTADVAAVVTLLTRYDFRLLLEFYSYEMKVENKAGKSAAQLLDELEKGHCKWTKGITAPTHRGVHPGIIYTLEMMLNRYDPVLLADMAQWAKLSMSACAEASQCQGLGTEKKWSNAQLVQLLEGKHQQREEEKRVERETKEVKRRFMDRLEQQDRLLAHRREWEARYFREQFWSTFDSRTMEVEMTGRVRGENEMNLDEPDMGNLDMMGIDSFAPGPPPDGTLPMDMGPDIDMDADGDMDMCVDQETEKRRERERYLEEARLKVKDVTNKENYADLFIKSRKPQHGRTEEKQAERKVDKTKPEEKPREAREKGADQKGNDKMDKQLHEAQRKRREQYEKQKREAEKEKQKRDGEKQERGRSRAGSASGSSGRRRSVSRPGSSSTTASGTGRQRRTSLSRAPSTGPGNPSHMREETKRPQLENDTVVDDNPMALVLARPPPPTLKLRPATPPNSSTPAGDDPFGPAPSTTTAKLDPKRTAFSSSTSNAPSSSMAPRLDLGPIKPARGSSSNLASNASLNKPTAPGKQPTKPMQRFDPNTATRHSNFNPNVGTKPNTPGNTLNPTFNPQPRGGPSVPAGPSPGSSSGPSPASSRSSTSLLGSGSGSSSSTRPRSGSGSGSGAGRPRAGSGSGSNGSPTRTTGRRLGGRARSSSSSSSSTSNKPSMSKIMDQNMNKVTNANANINPMALALQGGGSAFAKSGFAALGSSTASTDSSSESMSPVRTQKPVSSSSRSLSRVEKKKDEGRGGGGGGGGGKVARKPWLSDVAEVDEDLYGEEIGMGSGNNGEIKVEVQGQGDGEDMIDGSLRIEELGSDDADFMVDDPYW